MIELRKTESTPMKTILIFSGGMDSTVLLYHLLDQGHTVKALCIDYGQRHRKEIAHAQTLADNLTIPFQIADLRSLTPLLQGSSLTTESISVPEGHYEEATMKATVVPNRNMLMLSIATAWAISEKFDTVSYAAHGGDHAIYPDCREAFTQAMDTAMGLADWHHVTLNRPFVNRTKSDLVTLGTQLQVPFAKTWSCYQGGALHCGRCGTCVERREAFHLAGITDPTAYAANAFSIDAIMKKKLPRQ